MIRTAETADLQDLIDLGRRMHAESNYSELTFSERVYRQFLVALIEHEQGVVLVAERQGQIVGAYIGVVGNAFFSDDKIAQDYLLYVAPDHRGGMTAMRLIKAFETWAIGQGAKQLRPGISVGGDVETSSRLYQLAGYHTVGVNFLKTL